MSFDGFAVGKRALTDELDAEPMEPEPEPQPGAAIDAGQRDAAGAHDAAAPRGAASPAATPPRADRIQALFGPTRIPQAAPAEPHADTAGTETDPSTRR